MQLYKATSSIARTVNLKKTLDPDVELRRVLGNKIRYFRERLDYSQEELAKLAGRGLTGNAVSLIELGKREIKLYQLRALAKALNINPKELVDSFKYYVVFECWHNGESRRDDDEFFVSEPIDSIEQVKDYVRTHHCPDATKIFIFNFVDWQS